MTALRAVAWRLTARLALLAGDPWTRTDQRAYEMECFFQRGEMER